MSWFFDGPGEIRNRLDRCEQFGLPRHAFGALAHIASHCAERGIEPSEISLLAGGSRPGCDLVLYGTENCYTIRMEATASSTTLYFLPMDSKLSGPGCELYRHEWEGSDYVGGTLATLLSAEGFPIATYEQALAEGKAAIKRARESDAAYHRRRQLRQSLDSDFGQ